MRGKTVVSLFYEASTRTRTSFEIAAKRLSADYVSIASSNSSATKGTWNSVSEVEIWGN